MDGQYWVGRESVSNLVQTLRKMMASHAEQATKKTFGLTKREFEIIGAIVAGYSNKDIAREFKISEDTVKHHLTNVFDKVGVSSRLELALFAVNHKLVNET
jgi:two-component system nitrate/nitrite response regulator NarL